MNFGYLADDCNFPVAECGGEVAERCAYLVRSFVEYHRARLFNYALYVLGAARLVDAQKTLKSESSGGHAGCRHRRCECGRSWHMRTKSSPGSDIAGIPASVTSTQLSPFISRATILGLISNLLCS